MLTRWLWSNFEFIIFVVLFLIMNTFLFNDIIFGPVSSRRLGSSLGINLLPPELKICTYNCIYCECGWTSGRKLQDSEFPSRDLVRKALQDRLNELRKYGDIPDAITYAGNGEPTLHPDFEGIVDDSIRIRDLISPESRIVVLSNGSLAHRENVKRALLKVDQNVLKLDSGIEDTFRIMNQPPARWKLSDIISNLKSFNGKLTVQTLFIRGEFNGKKIDNTTDKEVTELIKLYKNIRPSEVMVYTIARGTPTRGLERVSYDELKSIAARIEGIGIKTQISG
jgi:wyosine [tRNA(Phe)-imidazoG37] synthetase (radical SAM superfamily)